MKHNKNQSVFNAIRNRKTGNVLVSHEVDGETIYFWVVMTAGGIISVKNNAGYVLREEDWEYMTRRNRGIKTKYPVTDGILKMYYKALAACENTQVAKFKSRKRKAKEFKSTGVVVFTVKTTKAKQTTFNSFASLGVLKKQMVG